MKRYLLTITLMAILTMLVACATPEPSPLRLSRRPKPLSQARRDRRADQSRRANQTRRDSDSRSQIQ